VTLMTDEEILEQIVRPNAKLAARRDTEMFRTKLEQERTYKSNAVGMLQARGYQYIAEVKIRRVWAKTLREERQKLGAESVDKHEARR